jgi:VCBS repeat protein/proprotein convertase P-domain-containing protein
VTQRLTLCLAAFVAALFMAPAALAQEEAGPDDAGFIVAGSKRPNGDGLVRIRADENIDGKYERLADSFDPYPGSSVGDGVRVAAGDLDGDGNEELVVAAGKGLPVKIFELNPDGTIGSLRESKVVFGPRGVFVALGDLNADGRYELIVGANSGAPQVRIYSDTDFDLKVFDNQTDSFSAYGASFKGGVRVAAGNVNNTGGAEVVTAQGPPGRTVKVWTDSDNDRAVSDNALQDQLAMYKPSFRGGLYVAAGEIQSIGGGGAEVVIGPGSGAQKVVIRTDTDADGDISDNPAFESFYPYGSGYKGGVRVGAGDTDHSSFFVEVMTAPGTNAGSTTKKLKIYDDDADANALVSDNPRDDQFVSMPSSVRAGAFVALARVRTATFVMPGFPISIPDSSTVVSDILVPVSAGRITDLDVSFNAFHSFDGDLDVVLTHVSTGTGLFLFGDVGGTNEGFEIRLNDEAGTDIGTATNPKLDGPISGTFNPMGAALLSIFDGQDASGLWRLTVTDDAGGDTGTLMSWALHVTY